jgi:DNA-binding protein Fis
MTDNTLYTILKTAFKKLNAGDAETHTSFNHVLTMLEEYKADIDVEEGTKVNEIFMLMQDWPLLVPIVQDSQGDRLQVAIMNLNPTHVHALVYKIEHDLPYALYNIVKETIEEKRNGRPDRFNMLIQKLMNKGCYNLSEQILQVGHLNDRTHIYPLYQVLRQLTLREIACTICHFGVENLELANFCCQIDKCRIHFEIDSI